MHSLIYSLLNLLVMFLIFSVIGAVMLFLIRLKMKWYFVTASGFIILSSMTFFMLSAPGPDGKRINPIEFMKSDIRSGMDKALASPEAGISPADIENAKKQVENFILRPLYGWVATGFIFMSFLCYMVVRMIAARKFGIENDFPPYIFWRPPEFVIWILIACMAAMVPYNIITIPSIIYDIAINLMVILGSYYFFIGAAVVNYMMVKAKVPRFLQVLVIVGVVFWSPASIIIMLTGILDTWFNFRKI